MPPRVQAVLEGGEIRGHLVLEQVQLGIYLFVIMRKAPEIALPRGIGVVKLGNGLRILRQSGVEGGKIVLHIAASNPIPARFGEGGHLPVGIEQIHMAALVIPGDLLAGDGDESPVLIIPIGCFVQETPVVRQGVVHIGQIIVPVAVVQADVVIRHAEKIQRRVFPDMLIRILRQFLTVAEGGMGVYLPRVKGFPHIGRFAAAVG